MAMINAVVAIPAATPENTKDTYAICSLRLSLRKTINEPSDRGMRWRDAVMIICENCGKTFESAWTDAEAAAEYAIEFPDQPPAEQGAVVCDQCYERMMAMFRPRQMN